VLPATDQLERPLVGVELPPLTEHHGRSKRVLESATDRITGMNSTLVEPGKQESPDRVDPRLRFD
jgi:hypothetical protein